MNNINKNMADGFILDIQIYKNYGEGFWAQAHYLVHGTDDVVWTNSLDDAVSYLRSELERIEKNDSNIRSFRIYQSRNSNDSE